MEYYIASISGEESSGITEKIFSGATIFQKWQTWWNLYIFAKQLYKPLLPGQPVRAVLYKQILS